MWVKRKPGVGVPWREEPTQRKRNKATSRRVADVLATVNSKMYTVLAKAESDSGGKDYEIRLGANHAVFCSCKGWQFSKNGTCKHLERFKRQVLPMTVVSDKR